MRRILPTLAAILTLSGAAHAQVPGAPSAGNTSAMGTTSPLGVPGPTSSATPAGIPLNATEIDPGGLSPLPSTACTTTPAGTFDGGGLTSCTTAAAQLSTSGTASPLATPGSDPAQTGATIPLNAIEITNAGVSPLITVPTTTTVGTTTTNSATLPTMLSPVAPSPTVNLPVPTFTTTPTSMLTSPASPGR